MNNTNENWKEQNPNFPIESWQTPEGGDKEYQEAELQEAKDNEALDFLKVYQARSLQNIWKSITTTA
jgi:hypothetical protein